MTKQNILEAAEWERIKEELAKKLEEHHAQCKHWATTNPHKVQNRDPQFPDNTVVTCAFCGLELKL